MLQLIERKRALGQFWTPGWVADAMIAYAAKNADLVFDPAVGAGAFFTALQKIYPEKHFCGTEIDSNVITITDDRADIEIQDFMLKDFNRKYPAIVANPPYIRHHRLSREQKTLFRELSRRILGCPLDG